jgi:hypothetical protein
MVARDSAARAVAKRIAFLMKRNLRFGFVVGRPNGTLAGRRCPIAGPAAQGMRP